MTISAPALNRAAVSSERLAIQLMVAQGALFAAETVIIHHLGSRASVMQLALIRGAGGLALAILLAWGTGLAVMRTRQLALQLLRGAVTLLYLWVMIYSFAVLPFADATAISYTQVAYIALFSMLILHEPVSALRWGAALMGIVGALLIAQPAFSGWDGAYLVVLVGTSLNGLAFVLNRYLQRKDTDVTTMFYTNLVLVVGSSPALVISGLPTPETLLWLPALLLFGPVGMYCGIVAVKHADASLLGPYTLLRLVLSIALAVAIFREVPAMVGYLGIALILLSCVLSSGGVKIPRRDLFSSPLRGWRCIPIPRWAGRA